MKRQIQFYCFLMKDERVFILFDEVFSVLNAKNRNTEMVFVAYGKSVISKLGYLAKPKWNKG